jgi:hypothetical protein
MAAGGIESGRIQTLLSAEGDVDQEVLTLAMLKAMGPQRYYQVRDRAVVIKDTKHEQHEKNEAAREYEFSTPFC